MNEKEADKTVKLPGIYRHKDTGVEVELTIQPKLGTPLINAYQRSGYEYVGPKPLESKEEAKSEVVSESSETESASTEMIGEDKYTVTEAKNGTVQYRKNGTLISKDAYEGRHNAQA